MREFLTAAALALALEGMIYTLAPDFMKRVMARILMLPSDQLRVSGVLAAVVGVVFVWLLRR